MRYRAKTGLAGSRSSLSGAWYAFGIQSTSAWRTAKRTGEVHFPLLVLLMRTRNTHFSKTQTVVSQQVCVSITCIFVPRFVYIHIEGFPQSLLGCWYISLLFSVRHAERLHISQREKITLPMRARTYTHCAARFQTLCNFTRVPFLLLLLPLCSIHHPMATQRGASGTSGTFSGLSLIHI